jgi:2,4-dienoyl-CoA reductase-like NADH-dependent reductase (Old Yellow Enzyme family)/thioredoxin reductase
MTDYPHVTSPLTVNNITLRNRITRTAHGTGFSVDGKVTERLIAYHEARARGGVGSLFTETTGVHPSCPGPLWAFRDEIIDGWAALADRLHAYDTRVFPQLWHGGPHVPLPDGTPAWAPSPIAAPIGGTLTQAMSKGQIDELVEGFASAAVRAQHAGLDGVEVHGGHGYLVGAFLSPMTNLRTDEYGGDLEGRSRLAREVLQAIRDAVGLDFVIGMRISGDEAAEGGIDPAAATGIRERLEQEGVLDYINVSMGGYHNFGKMIGAMHEPHGYELPSSSQVTAGRRIPAIVTGRILTLAEAEDVLASGAADLVSMVRALIADPELVNKTLEGRKQDVRPCIGCNEGCVGRRMAVGAAVGQTGCTVNPEAGFEYVAEPLGKADEPREVVVVGAGPAGLEAARTAALRGHRVRVYEAADRAGGVVSSARRAPYRHELGVICDWLTDELGRLDVPIELGRELRADEVIALEPDVVIAATGARERRDGIQRMRPALRVEGVELDHVATPVDVLDGRATGRWHAVVFDDLGNYQAVGAAEYLLDAGVAVTFATSFEGFAPDLFRSFQRDAAAARLGRFENYRLLTRTSIEKITPEAVTMRRLDGGAVIEQAADLVVLATGYDPAVELHEALAERGVDVRPAGDAVAPLLLPHAIASGREVGRAV